MYNYFEIKDWSLEMIKQHFPDRFMCAYSPFRSRQTSRYIQFNTPIQDDNIHYEYRIDANWCGCIELHFEGDDYEIKYGKLIDSLIDKTQENEQFRWTNWGWGFRCKFINPITSVEMLFDNLSMFMGLFDKYLLAFTSHSADTETVKIPILDSLKGQIESVDLHKKNLRSVLGLPLAIPDYQRIYCWEEQNVKCLLTDIFDHIENQDKKGTPYRLGCIILHNHDDKYDIIDGQQRLVTLSLLLFELGVCPNLLSEKFTNKKSFEYVAYNRNLVKSYVQKHINDLHGYAQKVLDNIEFSVLVLKNASLDLAYTFFSNQNSRGVPLSDYDLLKAHHLRYIPISFEQQSMRAAEVWNKMIENGRKSIENDEVPDYVTTLDTYIYRLRKWMRKKECDDSTDNYRIKYEYEAAPIVEEIPPFGERFYFNEPIQGGTHFFSFVEQHLDKFHQFIRTNEYQILHREMCGGSFQWYRDVIESLLFGYYLKFGSFCLADALVVIMRVILQHRYEIGKARKTSIIQYAGDSEFILMIDQATSPTFFLAEARNVAKELIYPNRQTMRPIMLRMRSIASSISRVLEKDIVISSFKYLNR